MGVDEVLLKIRALVEGQSQVKGLTGDVNALDSATSKLDTTYRDVNGRLRDAQGRFVAVGQAAREAGSGFSFAGGHLGKFSMNLTGLNAGLEIVQRVTQTVQGLMQGVGDLAHQYEAGQAAARQWEVVLERYGINAKTADAAMLELSNRTGVNIEALKGMAAQYVKMGGTLEDFQKGALAATSSWNDLSVKSISLEDSISNVTTGLAQGRSELMESSGIVVNASQAWEKWAEANDRTVKSMTDAEKAHAYAIAVYREEEIGISTLAERQTDLVKAETQAANAKKELGKAVGEIVLPLYTRYVQVGAEVTTQTLEIARAFVQGGDAVQALSQKYPQLAGTLQVIQRVFTDVRDSARDVFERTVQPALERLAPKVQQMGSVVAPTFVKLGQVLKEVAGTAREAFERVIVPLFEAVAPVVMRVVQRVLPLLAQLAGAFSEYFKMVVAAWENIALPVIQTIAPIVQRVVDVVANVLGGVIATVKNVFQAVRAMIEGDWSKAWEHLKTAVGTALLSVQTLLQGAGKIMADVLPKVWEKAKELGTSIKDGILTGIANLQDELAQAIGRAIQNMLGYIPEWAQRLLNITADGQSTMGYTGKSGTLGSLQSMLADLGLGSVPKSQGYGANRNLHGYGPGGHPGVDYAAPVGTKLYAPIAGTASYGYDHLSGRYIKLVDAEGNAIKLSHLSKVGEQLDAMMKAAGGAVQVAKGQLLGYSGGAKSDPMRGNSTGPHVDIMIYSKDGTIQNPERFRIGQGSRSPVPVPVTAPDAPPKVPKPTTPAPPANTTDPIKPEKAEDIRKRIEAQIKDILARVDIGVISKQAAIKLLQGIDDQATAVAKKQGKGWQEYAATAKSAESAIQSLTKTKKGTKDTVDVLAALSAQFEYAGKSGLPAYVKGLEAYIAQQERARKAAKDGSKEELEATQNVNRARQLLKDAQAGKGTAFVTEADLKKYRAGAEEVIRLEKAMATSTDVDWKRRAQNRITAYGEQGQAAQNVLSLLKSQDQTEENLSQKAKAREREQAALRAKVADERRQLSVTAAQQEQARIQELNREELATFKGTAAERLAIVTRQAKDEENARLAVARATRDKELRESANAGGANQGERDRQINQRYTNEETAAANARDAAVRQARQGVQDEAKAVTDLIGRYRDLTSALQDKADAGTVTGDDLVKYGRDLAGLWEQAGKAGVKTLPQIKAAHDEAKAFGLAAQGLSDTVVEWANQLDATASGTQEYLQSIRDDLKNIHGMSEDGLIELYDRAVATRDQTLVQETWNAINRERDRQKAEDAQYLEWLKQQGLVSGNEMDYSWGNDFQATQVPDGNGGTTEVNTPSTAPADPNVARNETAQNLLNTLSKLNAATLQNADSVEFYTNMIKGAGGESGLTEQQVNDLASALTVLQQAANLSADDFDVMRQSLLDAMEDGKLTKQELADLMQQIQLLQDAAAEGVQFTVTATDENGQTLSSSKLPEPASFEAMKKTAAALQESMQTDALLTSDSTEEVKKQVEVWQQIIDNRVQAKDISAAQGEELKRNLDLIVRSAEATRSMTGVQLQGQLAQLERDKAEKKITENVYLHEKERLEILIENERYRLAIIGKTDKEIEVLAAQHQQNLKDIESRGRAARGQADEQGKRALEDARDEQQSLTRRSEQRKAAWRHDLTAQLGFLKEQEDQERLAAQRSFERETEGLDQTSDAYKAAAIRLQNEQTRIAEEGTAARIALIQSEFEWYAQMADQVLGALGKLAQAMSQTEQQYDKTGKALNTPWTDLAANIEGAQKAIALAVDMSKDVAKIAASGGADVGAWISLATKVISAIADALSGFKKAYAEAKRLRDDFAEANPLLQEGEFQKSSVRSRGWLADIFVGPEVVNEIDKVRLPIAQTIAEGVMNGMKTGFQKYLETGDMEDYAKALQDSVSNAVKNALADSFMNDPARNAEFAAGITELTDTINSGDPERIAKAQERMGVIIKSNTQAAQKYAETMEEIDRQNGTGRFSPEAMAARERELAQQRSAIEEQQNELAYTQGTRSRAEYEREKLRLAKERIQQEMEVQLAAEGLTAEQVALIRQRFGLQQQQAQAEFDKAERDRALKQAQDLQQLRLNNAETALRIEQGVMMAGLDTQTRLALANADTEEEKWRIQQDGAARRYALEEDFERRRLQLTLNRIAAEEQAELARLAAEGAGEELLAATRERFDLARQEAETSLSSLTRQHQDEQLVAAAEHAAQLRQQQESMLTSWRQPMSGAVSALLDGGSPLQALYDGVRSRITQAIQDGLVVKRLLGSLDPLFTQLDEAISKGMNPNGIIASIGAAMPGLAVEMQTTLGPIMAALNAAIPQLTSAVQGNTRALQEVQVSQTTIVDATPNVTYSNPLRAKFATRYS